MFIASYTCMGFKLCIIADDFTGAGDSAVQFRKRGYSPFLALQDWESGLEPGLYDVLVVSTESRFLIPDRSYSLVRRTVESCRKLGIQRFFKKIDSTLRGNVAEEIAAVMDAGAYDCAVVAPSAPKNGRTVVAGNCLVNGIPIGEDGGNSDPFTPVSSAFIPGLLEHRFPGEVGHIDLDTVRGGSEKFMRCLKDRRQNGARVIVVDAETLEDLRIAASAQQDRTVLCVGSSGLAEALTEPGKAAAMKLPLIEAGKLLFVVGSLTETSRSQMEDLQRSTDLFTLSISIRSMIGDEEKELSRIMHEVSQTQHDLPVLIRTFDGEGEYRKDIDYANALGISEKELGGNVSEFLGKLVSKIFLQRHIEAVFVTGGNTAAGVSRSLKVKGVELVDELLPGIPIGKFDTPCADHPVYLISKAGGFGKPDAMTQVCIIVTGMQEQQPERK